MICDHSWSPSTYLGVVRNKERGGAIVFHEVFGEKAHPGVVSVEDDPLPCCFGLPNEVVLQQSRRIQVHYHIYEAWDAPSGQSLGTNTTLSPSVQQQLPFLIVRTSTAHCLHITSYLKMKIT